VSKQKAAYEAASWEELSKLATLDDAKKALKAYETSRLAHKAYNLKKATILARAKQAGITAD
jgi:hypothetical protein